MAIMSAVKNIMGMFDAKKCSELPHGIKKGVEKYIKEEESILVTLLNWRVVYKAPRFIDSNTYFHTWFILTDHRIIIARNSSGFLETRRACHGSSLIRRSCFGPGPRCANRHLQ